MGIFAKCMKLLLQKYIAENIKEIKSELSIHLTELEITKVFRICKSLTYRSFYFKDEIVEYIEDEFPNIQTADKIFKLLISYSILIYRNSLGKLYFNYRENNLESTELDDMQFTLHKCVYSYFNPNQL